MIELTYSFLINAGVSATDIQGISGILIFVTVVFGFLGFLYGDEIEFSSQGRARFLLACILIAIVGFFTRPLIIPFYVMVIAGFLLYILLELILQAFPSLENLQIPRLSPRPIIDAGASLADHFTGLFSNKPNRQDSYQESIDQLKQEQK